MEACILKKEVESLNIELRAEIEKSSLKLENNLKSEINKLKIWIAVIIFTASMVFLALLKFLR